MIYENYILTLKWNTTPFLLKYQIVTLVWRSNGYFIVKSYKAQMHNVGKHRNFES